MAELKEGQQIIFRHPGDAQIRLGVYDAYSDTVIYLTAYPGSDEVDMNDIQAALIKEWCDAESAWAALENIKTWKMTPKPLNRNSPELTNSKPPSNVK